ncbi:hypothetical protein LX36DRAFT_251516 [Colletotrichum falcatum]|nr:hypothetical protein LX36DRAFT_251516 [Colletotrichum falcatum]
MEETKQIQDVPCPELHSPERSPSVKSRAKSRVLSRVDGSYLPDGPDGWMAGRKEGRTGRVAPALISRTRYDKKEPPGTEREVSQSPDQSLLILGTYLSIVYCLGINLLGNRLEPQRRGLRETIIYLIRLRAFGKLDDVCCVCPIEPPNHAERLFPNAPGHLALSRLRRFRGTSNMQIGKRKDDASPSVVMVGSSPLIIGRA